MIEDLAARSSSKRGRGSRLQRQFSCCAEDGRLTMDESSLTDDLRKMLGDTRFSDMVFICSDGEEVPALRMLVAARSPVLQSLLLTSGMVESRLGRVPLAETRGPVMRVCVEFLYTGHVQDSSWPKPLDEAMEIAAAARFFLIKGLETHCIDHLCVAIKRVDDSSVGVVAHEIISAYNLGAELCRAQPHKELDVLLATFAKSVQSALNLSFDCYMRLSQCGCLRLLGDLRMLDTSSPKGYHLLLYAIRWCASRVLLSNPVFKEDKMLKLLDTLLPSSDAHLRIVLDKRCQYLYESASKDPVIQLLADPLASLLDKSCLDLSNVPLTILCAIFEPLKILPCSKLLAAYKIHALSRPDLRLDDLSLQQSYMVSEFDPTEITCVKTPCGSAGVVASNMCVRPSNCLVSEWEMVMLEPCKKFRYGFYFTEERLIAAPNGLLCLPTRRWVPVMSVALGSNGTLYQSSGFLSFFMNRKIDGAKGVRLCVTKGTKLGVHIDFREGRCSFKVDGVTKASDSISSWNGGGVYPAISMEEPGKCRLQMVIQESVLKKDILTVASPDQGGLDSKKRRHE